MNINKDNLEELEEHLDRVLEKAEELKKVLKEIDNLQDNSPRGWPNVPSPDKTNPNPFLGGTWIWNIETNNNTDDYCDGCSGDIWQDIYD